jgi:hypothetical protein
VAAACNSVTVAIGGSATAVLLIIALGGWRATAMTLSPENDRGDRKVDRAVIRGTSREGELSRGRAVQR